MRKEEAVHKSKEELQKQVKEQSLLIEDLRYQLEEALETIEAIRSGQIDALVVQGDEGHQLYTLKSADHTYRVFIEKMTEGAVTLNKDGLILYCNSQFATMVNMPLSQVIGLEFSAFVAPEHSLQYRELFQKCWKEDCKGEVLLLTGEKQIPVQLSLTILELDEGAALSIILTDLTVHKATQQQLKRNNEQLEEANNKLEASNHDLQQFASVASHDLQEPLRKILIFSHLLKEKQSDLSPLSINYLNKVIDSTARMRTLIVDILNYSRLSANDVQMECTDLNDIANELKEDFELLIQEKGAQIIVDDLPCVDVNKGQIRQVFYNIISNALKFSRPDTAPVVTIHSKRISHKSFDSPEDPDGPYYLITIQDNGIGFNQKYVTNIFALFERLNAKDKFEGTGIGMAIAKKIIDKHNGLITAHSKEGQGAAFRIILPIKQ